MYELNDVAVYQNMIHAIDSKRIIISQQEILLSVFDLVS